MLEMNPEIRARWVAALRSGDYRQGKAYLREGDRFCCLGVLCDLAVQDSVVAPEAPEPGLSAWWYDEQCAMLPGAVWRWAGLRDGHPEIYVQGYCGACELTDLNDEWNWGFARIADAIEATP